MGGTVSISYVAAGGSAVDIPTTLDPYKQLGISKDTSIVDTKKER